MYMNPLTTTQRLEQAGFDRKQAEAIAVGYDSLDEKMDSIIVLLQGVVQSISEVKSELAEVKADVATLKADVATLKAEMAEVKSELSEVKKGLAETNQRLTDFQLATERRFSEIVKNIADSKVFMIMWMVGIMIVVGGGMYAAMRDLFTTILSLG